MSDDERIDFRRKFLQLFGCIVIAATIGVVIWAVVRLGSEVLKRAEDVRCRENLRAIAAALDMYRSAWTNRLPPYLAALVPMLEKQKEKLVCPADTDHGRSGCLPAWLRPYYKEMFTNADLDGPTIDPETSADTVACSYLYGANMYPCHLPEAKPTWREEFEHLLQKHGDSVPLVRCYHHLPEHYVGETNNPSTRYPAPNITPTYNISAGLRIREYPLVWFPAVQPRHP